MSSNNNGAIGKAVEELRAAYNQGITKSYEWRMEQLKGFQKMIAEHKL